MRRREAYVLILVAFGPWLADRELRTAEGRNSIQAGDLRYTFGAFPLFSLPDWITTYYDAVEKSAYVVNSLLSVFGLRLIRIGYSGNECNRKRL